MDNKNGIGRFQVVGDGIVIKKKKKQDEKKKDAKTK